MKDPWFSYAYRLSKAKWILHDDFEDFQWNVNFFEDTVKLSFYENTIITRVLYAEFQHRNNRQFGSLCRSSESPCKMRSKDFKLFVRAETTNWRISFCTFNFQSLMNKIGIKNGRFFIFLIGYLKTKETNFWNILYCTGLFTRDSLVNFNWLKILEFFVHLIVAGEWKRNKGANYGKV